MNVHFIRFRRQIRTVCSRCEWTLMAPPMTMWATGASSYVIAMRLLFLHRYTHTHSQILIPTKLVWRNGLSLFRFGCETKWFPFPSGTNNNNNNGDREKKGIECSEFNKIFSFDCVFRLCCVCHAHITAQHTLRTQLDEKVNTKREKKCHFNCFSCIVERKLFQ